MNPRRLGDLVPLLVLTDGCVLWIVVGIDELDQIVTNFNFELNVLDLHVFLTLFAGHKFSSTSGVCKYVR